MESKQVTLRIDAESHKRVKYKLIETGESFNKYVNDLIEADLSSSDNCLTDTLK